MKQKLVMIVSLMLILAFMAGCKSVQMKNNEITGTVLQEDISVLVGEAKLLGKSDNAKKACREEL